MIERHVEIPSRNGPIPTFAVCPDGPGSYPGIILYMDAPGIREELHNLARRIAKHGYFCALPDMYYRLGTLRFNMARRRAEGRMATMFARDELADQRARGGRHRGVDRLARRAGKSLAGTDGLHRLLHERPLHRHRGGALRQPLRGSASLYGVGIVTKEEDSPHKLVPKIKGEIYFGFAEHDPHVAAGTIPTLKDALKTAKTRHTLEILPGTHHGYQFPERDVYDTDAAENSWAKIFDMWKRVLKGA